jgi:hypothetical protein
MRAAVNTDALQLVFQLWGGREGAQAFAIKDLSDADADVVLAKLVGLLDALRPQLPESAWTVGRKMDALDPSDVYNGPQVRGICI